MLERVTAGGSGAGTTRADALQALLNEDGDSTDGDSIDLMVRRPRALYPCALCPCLCVQRRAPRRCALRCGAVALRAPACVCSSAPSPPA